jgi:MYXO-CTERM domain-containing protein
MEAMMNTKSHLKLIAASALIAFGGAAHAAACGTAPMDTSDVTYSVNGPAAGPYTNATDCDGPIDGNIQPSDTVTQFGGNWQYADANDANSGTATLFGGGFTFTLTAPNGDPSGAWTLTATDNNGVGVPPDFPLVLDFVVALKASDTYALYYFNDVTFDGSGGGAWEVQFAFAGGKTPDLTNPQDLSHLTVFTREGSSTSSQSSQSSLTVSEPGSSSLALMGLGLLAGSFVLRRRSLGR